MSLKRGVEFRIIWVLEKVPNGKMTQVSSGALLAVVVCLVNTHLSLLGYEGRMHSTATTSAVY